MKDGRTCALLFERMGKRMMISCQHHLVLLNMLTSETPSERLRRVNLDGRFNVLPALRQVCSGAGKPEVVDVSNQQKLELIMEKHTLPNTFQQQPPLVLSKASLEMILPQATAVSMTIQCQNQR